MSWLERIRQLIRRDNLDNDLHAEMELHMELKAQDLVEQGLSPEEARRAAHRSFGNALQQAEESRWYWLPRWLDECAQDVRYSLRSLAHSPALVATVLLTMALGIGANTSIFSLVETLMLRQLPVPDPDSLLEIRPKLRDPNRWTSSGDDSWSFSYPLYREVQAAQNSFSCMYGLNVSRLDFVSTGGNPWDTRPRGHYVSGCYFETIGVKPALGRFFSTADIRGETAAPVAVLSHGLWQRRFSGDPAVIGQNITVGPAVLQIVGVAPPGFTGDTPSQPADLWMPLETFGVVSRWEGWNSRNSAWFPMMGRLRPGVDQKRASAELTGLLRNFVRKDIASWKKDGDASNITPEMFRVELKSGSGGFNDMRERYESALRLLMGIVLLLLLLACLNVAGLLLARGAARTRELSVRLSLGASSGRIIRQLLLESLLLAGAGAAVGLIVAHEFSLKLVSVLGNSTDPLDIPYRLNAPVLGFTLVLTVLAAMAAGLLPAWQSTRTGLSASLAAAGRAVTQSRNRLLWNRGLVVAQVAVGVLLATGAGLMLRTLNALNNSRLGVDVNHVLVAFLDFIPQVGNSSSKNNFERQAAGAAAMQRRLETLPGVESATLAHMAPMSGWMMSSTYFTPTRSTGLAMVQHNWVGEDYFETLGTGLVAGRLFTPADQSRRVCVIDEDLARELFGTGNPIGQSISGGRSYNPKEATEIIGVVRANRWQGPKQSNTTFKGMIWEPLAASRRTFQVAMIRTTGDEDALAAAVRRAIAETLPAMQVTKTTTLRRLRDDLLQQERLLAALCSLFGVVALVLIFAGLYGLLSYTVERRIPEIGIRLALGASRPSVFRLINREALVLIVLGLAAGLPAAFALAQLLKSFLWGITPDDPASYVLTVVVVVAAGILAAARPARKAADTEPVAALRQE